MAYDRLYTLYIYYFNIKRDYFECHEVLEELWMEEGRNPMYQGLLQIAVGLYHHQNDNVNGAMKLFALGIEKLEPIIHRAHGLGINLSKLVEDAKNYAAKLEQWDQTPYDSYDLDIEILDPVLTEEVKRLSLKESN